MPVQSGRHEQRMANWLQHYLNYSIDRNRATTEEYPGGVQRTTPGPCQKKTVVKMKTTPISQQVSSANHCAKIQVCLKIGYPKCSFIIITCFPLVFQCFPYQSCHSGTPFSDPSHILELPPLTGLPKFRQVNAPSVALQIGQADC